MYVFDFLIFIEKKNPSKGALLTYVSFRVILFHIDVREKLIKNKFCIENNFFFRQTSIHHIFQLKFIYELKKEKN